MIKRLSVTTRRPHLLTILYLATCLFLFPVYDLTSQAKATTPNQMDGLIYLHGRYYDPQLMRFMSPDPYVPEMGNLGINRYAYVGNTPINATDPSGYRPVRRRQQAKLKALRVQNRALQAKNAKLKRSPVSGLPGGHLYNDALKASEGKDVVHGFVDAANFKAVNDYATHSQGSDVLRYFGQTLQETVGDKGDVFHPHGDEFQIIGKPGVSEDQLKACLLEAQNKCNIKVPSAKVKGGIQTGINIGVGSSPDEAEEAMMLDKAAFRTRYGIEERSGIDRRQGDPIRGKFRTIRAGIVGAAIALAIDELVNPDTAYSETHTLDPQTYNNALARLSGHNPVLPPYVVNGEAQCYGQVHAAC